ncbi:hypothetical protein [Uliginosibacterium sediminicola]|uniref:Uncharacterized protein n=1 Tax=Uliginosibacterium sediminicola TaxID=2024550 RepID=A0ABU9YV39_9RHOO
MIWPADISKPAAGVLSLSLLLSLALLYAGFKLRADAQEEFAQLQRAQQHSAALLQQAQHEQSAIEQALARLGELQAQGIAGSAKRLQWMADMQQLRQSIALPDLDAELAAQEALQPKSAGSFRLLNSRMQIHAALLHELDLFTLLAHLHTRRDALVAARHCTLSPDPAPTASHAALRADCVFDWISLGTPEQSE